MTKKIVYDKLKKETLKDISDKTIHKCVFYDFT